MELFSTHITCSAEDTERLGAALAENMRENSELPRFIAMFGDLGVGKTAFTRGYVSVVAPYASVRSPTFALVNEYKGEKMSVFHFDMYRISDGDELYAIGFYDYLDRNGVCLVEWSENIEEFLPDRYIRVIIEKNSYENAEERSVKIDKIGF